MLGAKEEVSWHHPLTPGAAASETSFGVNLLVLVLSAGLTAGAWFLGLTSYAGLFVVLMGAELTLTVLLEAVFFPKTCALARLKVRRSLDWRRVAFREAALLATFGVIALAYWMLPLFSDEAMAKAYFPFLRILVPIALALSVPYFCLADRLDPEEEDVTCRIGRALLTFRRTVTRAELGNYARTWLVKAFWLSVMQPQVAEKLNIFVHYHWEKLQKSHLEVYLMASVICFAIDLAYAAPGYALNLKLFNLHTRTAEPTLLGWLAAVFCYWPFWGILFYPYFFRYEPGVQWNTLFVEGGAVWWAWGGAIILLELLYAAATVSAGVRFSNLTYRGLWNTGPYRWTKHPAYVFKCVSWWLVYLPFVLGTGAAAVRCTLLLVLVNGIYWLRAKTEERHLSHYPEYVAYAEAMNDRSIFRWCAKILPCLRYTRPSAS